MKKYAVLFLVSVISLATGLAEEPQRNLGLSLHMLPEGVAKLSGEPGGFTVSGISGTRPPKNITLKDVQDVEEFFKKQAPGVQKNGIWIVYTHPDSYTPKELKELTSLVEDSKNGAFILFTCRASELPNGWKKAQ